MMDYSAVAFDIRKESNKLREKFKHETDKFEEKTSTLPVKKSAVLLVVFQYQGRPHVILTERSRNLRTHGGDVALPGGMIDPTDRAAIDGALREAEEEIGLGREHVTIVGALPLTYSLAAKAFVSPIVGFIVDIENVTLTRNADEVESVFAVPLEVFIRKERFEPYSVQYNEKKFDTLCFFWDAKGYASNLFDDRKIKQVPLLKSLFFDKTKTYKIWGLTANILVQYSTLFFEKNAEFDPDGKYAERLEKWYSYLYRRMGPSQSKL